MGKCIVYMCFIINLRDWIWVWGKMINWSSRAGRSTLGLGTLGDYTAGTYRNFYASLIILIK